MVRDAVILVVMDAMMSIGIYYEKRKKTKNKTQNT